MRSEKRALEPEKQSCEALRSWPLSGHPPPSLCRPRPGISLPVLFDFIHRQVRGHSPHRPRDIPGLQEKKDVIIEEVSIGVDLLCTCPRLHVLHLLS